MLIWPKCSPDLSDDTRLANKGDKDEKAPQEIQTVYEPENGGYEVEYVKK